MSSVFSHIVQKRFTQINEDIATDALAFVLQSSEDARNGIKKPLRGILRELPPLYFLTQQVESTIRSDMWGFDGGVPHMFLENKFWAGLTDNQPISYLYQLATHPHPTVVLVIALAARRQTLWFDLSRRLREAGITIDERVSVARVVQSGNTEIGTVLAISPWPAVLSALEHATVNDPAAGGGPVRLALGRPWLAAHHN